MGYFPGMAEALIMQCAVIMQERSDSAGLQGHNVSEAYRIGLHNLDYGASVL